jgi:tetratricopeptide (TPR) repeat protein
MIEEWKTQLYKNSRSSLSYEEWGKNEKWPEPNNEYSVLFETVYDQPAQRRNYIEECIKQAHPNWGYIYLVSIISKDYFNVIFTPNFDDLINEACSSYVPKCKPIVCAHDSAVGGIRITSKRPKIIKLHGDFLYDNIKNTRKETDTLEKNMREKFAQFAIEYGLVVIGYGGNDYSIMEVLEQLLRSDGYFPNGIYWCLRKDSQISSQLDRLFSRDRVYVVVIDSFDEFMAELHEDLNLTLPDDAKNPYKAITSRLNHIIINKFIITNPLILRDTEEIIKQVKRYEPLLSKDLTPEETPIPYDLIGWNERNKLNFNEAIYFLKKAIKQKPANIFALQAIGIIYAVQGMQEEANHIVEQLKAIPKSFAAATAISFIISATDPDMATSVLDNTLELHLENSQIVSFFISKSNALLIQKKYSEAISDADKGLSLSPDEQILLLNKAWPLKNLGKAGEAKKIAEGLISSLQKSEYENKHYLLSSAYCLLDDKPKMLASLDESFEVNI